MPRTKKTPEVPTDRLDEMLVRLKLTGIRDQLDNLFDEAARANLSARETLMLLCEREIARKDHRRIDMALKLAHFPAVKELADEGYAMCVDLTAVDYSAHPDRRLPDGVAPERFEVVVGLLDPSARERLRLRVQVAADGPVDAGAQ